MKPSDITWKGHQMLVLCEVCNKHASLRQIATCNKLIIASGGKRLSGAILESLCEKQCKCGDSSVEEVKNGVVSN